VKDSAGDPEATLRLIGAHPDLMVLVGDETYLGRACAAGAEGSICGLANLFPEAVIALAEAGEDDPRVIDLVRAITAHPVIPIIKLLMAHLRGDSAWAVARPPLPTLDSVELRALAPLLIGFGIPLAGAAE
jgi:4-hydroxy-tetrahydrodipicolinate synthase